MLTSNNQIPLLKFIIHPFENFVPENAVQLSILQLADSSSFLLVKIGTARGHLLSHGLSHLLGALRGRCLPLAAHLQVVQLPRMRGIEVRILELT